MIKNGLLVNTHYHTPGKPALQFLYVKLSSQCYDNIDCYQIRLSNAFNYLHRAGILYSLLLQNCYFTATQHTGVGSLLTALHDYVAGGFSTGESTRLIAFLQYYHRAE